MRQKIIQLIIALSLVVFVNSVSAESYEDNQNGFKLDYSDVWQESTALSATIKFSLASSIQAKNRRPLATLSVSVKEMDAILPLEKYIKNNIKIASRTWSILEEKSLPSLGESNRLMIMERNMGRHSQKVYKLIVKNQGRVYETNCAMSKQIVDTFESQCLAVINSFQLIP